MTEAERIWKSFSAVAEAAVERQREIAGLKARVKELEGELERLRNPAHNSPITRP